MNATGRRSVTVAQVNHTSHWPSPSSGVLDGPWEQAFYFTVRGEVRSKSNYRFDRAGRAQWATLTAYCEQVALAARSARPRGWSGIDPGTPLDARPVIVACLFARTILDVGNLDKSILDAVESPTSRGKHTGAGIVMVDDAQVGASLSFGVRTTHDPGVVAAFARLQPAAKPAMVAAAGADLLTQVSTLVSSAC